MGLRVLLLSVPLLAACAASPAPALVSPRVAARRAQCAEENPLDAAARVGCEADRARAAAPPAPPRRAQRRAPGAPLVLVLPSAPAAPAGQGLVDYGRQLAAPPVRCTSIRMGAFVSTGCQ